MKLTCSFKAWVKHIRLNSVIHQNTSTTHLFYCENLKSQNKTAFQKTNNISWWESLNFVNNEVILAHQTFKIPVATNNDHLISFNIHLNHRSTEIHYTIWRIMYTQKKCYYWQWDKLGMVNYNMGENKAYISARKLRSVWVVTTNVILTSSIPCFSFQCPTCGTRDALTFWWRMLQCCDNRQNIQPPQHSIL